MIDRGKYLDRVQAGLRRSPVVALIGPRQGGKTTLARQVLPSESSLYFDLEDFFSGFWNFSHAARDFGFRCLK
ncbi:MAG: AAA family ATPase [Spartobacteria bacterium]